MVDKDRVQDESAVLFHRAVVLAFAFQDPDAVSFQ